MPNKKNVETVVFLKDKINTSTGLVFFNYRGVTVSQLTNIRRELGKNTATLKVCKNSLVDIALKELGLEVKEEMFKEPTAVVFVEDDFSSSAKVVFEASKKNDKIKIKGGYSGKELLDEVMVTKLASIPSREVLLAQIVAAISATISSLAYTLDALEEQKKEKQSA